MDGDNVVVLPRARAGVRVAGSAARERASCECEDAAARCRDGFAD